MQSPMRRASQPFNLGVHFQPDVLTSFEFLKTYRRLDHLLPEVRLMFAVLTNAVECLQKYAGSRSRRCRRIFDEAEQWIYHGESRKLYSFEHVCEVLQLDPSYLRKGLMRWKDEVRGDGETHRRIREPLRYRRRLRNTRISI